MSMVSKARSAWGKDLPDWVNQLAQAADSSSLRKVCAELGLSPAMASLSINNGRKNLTFAQAKVESGLGSATITCPVLGSITKTKCVAEQTADFNSANPLSIQLYRACHNGCANYKGA